MPKTTISHLLRHHHIVVVVRAVHRFRAMIDVRPMPAAIVRVHVHVERIRTIYNSNYFVAGRRRFRKQPHSRVRTRLSVSGTALHYARVVYNNMGASTWWSPAAACLVVCVESAPSSHSRAPQDRRRPWRETADNARERARGSHHNHRPPPAATERKQQHGERTRVCIVSCRVLCSGFFDVIDTHTHTSTPSYTTTLVCAVVAHIY